MNKSSGTELTENERAIQRGQAREDLAIQFNTGIRVGAEAVAQAVRADNGQNARAALKLLRERFEQAAEQFEELFPDGGLVSVRQAESGNVENH